MGSRLAVVMMPSPSMRLRESVKSSLVSSRLVLGSSVSLHGDFLKPCPAIFPSLSIDSLTSQAHGRGLSTLERLDSRAHNNQ